MIDIQSPKFLEDFDISRATVGQVGYGFIGNAVVELFRPHVSEVLVYDKAGYEGKVQPSENVGFASRLDVLVRECEVIFVAVPTPMKKSGECHTGIVESVLQDIQNIAVSIGRSLDSFIVVIKSTVPPGFTVRMQDKYALRLLFSPEFLTEANSVRDFKTTNRVLLGGDQEDARIVYKYFAGVWPDRTFDVYVDHPDGPVYIVHCDPTAAEMVKLSTNVHLTSKVLISNEIYLICRALGIDYDTVKSLTQFDRRIGTSHMNVPGPDGHLGYGGHCFVKDTQSLAFISEQLGISRDHGGGIPNGGCCNEDGSQISLFRSLHRRNLGIRDDRDWEAQKGRAVVDD
jgi:UDPglucose 6-dehydrogenase